MNGSQYMYIYYEALLFAHIENELSTNIANSFHLDTDSHAPNINKIQNKHLNKQMKRDNTTVCPIHMRTNKHTRKCIIYSFE